MFIKPKLGLILSLMLILWIAGACTNPTPVPATATSLQATDTSIPATQTTQPSPTPPPSATPDPGRVQLQVDPAQMVNHFSDQMLGMALVNWEHSWGKPFPNDTPGLAQAMRAANIRLIRYAGGLWSNDVGWDREPQRTPNTEWSVNGNTYYFHYGRDEIDNLAAFADAIDAEVMIQVNITEFDPQMWADMLTYTNLENDYGFKYWEIGNELDHASDQNVSPEEYARRAEAYITALKAVDPHIITVGGVPASAHDGIRLNWDDNVTDLSAYLVEAAQIETETGEMFDALSYHWYQVCYFQGLENILVYQFPMEFDYDPDLSWRNQYSRIWGEIAPQRVEDELLANRLETKQGITELNLDACDFGRAPQNSNHLNAVWAADAIGRLAYNGLDFLTWYQGFGTRDQGYPAIYPDDDVLPTRIFLRPIYYTFFMYGNYFGDMMVASSSSEPEALSVWASTDTSDEGKLKLMVVNISDQPIDAALSSAGFQAQKASIYTLNSENPTEMGDISNEENAWTRLNGQSLDPMNVADSAQNIQPEQVDLSGPYLDWTFEPFSVTAIILEQ